MKGVIYELYNDNFNESYIGSTKDLKARINGHKTSCNNSNNNQHHLKLYKFIREHGDFSDWSFRVLEEIDYDHKKELYLVEKKHILNNEHRLNVQIPCFDKKENYQKNRIQRIESQTKYNLRNRAEISLYKKEWYKKKKEKCIKQNEEINNIQI